MAAVRQEPGTPQVHRIKHEGEDSATDAGRRHGPIAAATASQAT
ncbi:MAG: hypothetical protein AB1778_06150 [Candidatus Bipolaricaulota bacterium]